MIKKFFFTLFFIFLIQPVYSKTVKAIGEWKHVGDITPKEACQKALEKARVKAITDATGVTITREETQKCNETDNQVDCKQNQFSVMSLNGIITQEKQIGKEERLEELGDQKIYICQIQIEALVEKIFEKDPAFEINSKLNKSSYRDGEMMEIEIQSNADMYLTIFQYLPYEKVDPIQKLFPSSRQKDNKLVQERTILPQKNKEGFQVKFPNKIKLKNVDEHLIIIATKRKYSWLTSYFSLEDLKKRLHDIQRQTLVDWEQKTYTIFR